MRPSNPIATPQLRRNSSQIQIVKRSTRRSIARDTVAILESGTYQAPAGRTVDLREAIAACKSATTCYGPNELVAMRRKQNPDTGAAARITVGNETSLQSARELLESGAERVACLNFASAKNPGGGFLGGAEAQEEAICRPSALYASLLTANEDYYEPNRQSANCLYLDHAIYSPDVPVFRDEEGVLLDDPYLVSFVTAPAPNRGAIERNSPELVSEIETVFRRRIINVLAIMAAHGHRDLVLGAWGCGVFRNSPTDVAEWFRQILAHDGWQAHFDQIRFGVLDRSSDLSTLAAFQRQFAP